MFNLRNRISLTRYYLFLMYITYDIGKHRHRYYT